MQVVYIYIAAAVAVAAIVAVLSAIAIGRNWRIEDWEG